jgi:integrase
MSGVGELGFSWVLCLRKDEEAIMAIAWSQFTEDVLALYLPPIRRLATYRKMRQVLGEFSAFCPTTADLTPAAIAGWLQAHPERRPETTLALLRTLRAACTYGVLVSALDANPFNWRKPTAWVDWDVPELDPPVHTSEEMARVLALADQEASGGAWKALRLRAVVYTLAYTGARKREVLGLAVADVDLVGGCIAIRTNRRRGLKTRSSRANLPIPSDLGRVLAAWMPLTGCDWLFPGAKRQGPWLEGPPGLKAIDQIKALGLRAGVQGLTIASFRHTFASLSESWGIGETMLQRILRHSSIKTQRSYRHPLAEGLREAGAKVHF